MEILNDDYWDCNCDEYYIHKKSDRIHCALCQTTADDSPDSRQNEIDDAKNFFNKHENVAETC